MKWLEIIDALQDGGTIRRGLVSDRILMFHPKYEYKTISLNQWAKLCKCKFIRERKGSDPYNPTYEWYRDITAKEEGR